MACRSKLVASRPNKRLGPIRERKSPVVDNHRCSCGPLKSVWDCVYKSWGISAARGRLGHLLIVRLQSFSWPNVLFRPLVDTKSADSPINSHCIFWKILHKSVLRQTSGHKSYIFSSQNGIINRFCLYLDFQVLKGGRNTWLVRLATHRSNFWTIECTKRMLAVWIQY